MTKHMTNLNTSNIYMTSILAQENYQILTEITKFTGITKSTRTINFQR